MRAGGVLLTSSAPDFTNEMALIFNIGRINKDKPTAPRPPQPPADMSSEGKHFIEACLDPGALSRAQ